MEKEILVDAIKNRKGILILVLDELDNYLECIFPDGEVRNIEHDKLNMDSYTKYSLMDDSFNEKQRDRYIRVTELRNLKAS
jgi:hypothetical protein